MDLILNIAFEVIYAKYGLTAEIMLIMIAFSRLISVYKLVMRPPINKPSTAWHSRSKVEIKRIPAGKKTMLVKLDTSSVSKSTRFKLYKITQANATAITTMK